MHQMKTGTRTSGYVNSVGMPCEGTRKMAVSHSVHAFLNIHRSAVLTALAWMLKLDLHLYGSMSRTARFPSLVFSGHNIGRLGRTQNKYHYIQ